MIKKEKTIAREFLIIGAVLGFLIAGNIWGPSIFKIICIVLTIIGIIFFTAEFIFWVIKKIKK